MALLPPALLKLLWEDCARERWGGGGERGLNFEGFRPHGRVCRLVELVELVECCDNQHMLSTRAALGSHPGLTCR